MENILSKCWLQFSFKEQNSWKVTKKLPWKSFPYIILCFNIFLVLFPQKFPNFYGNAPLRIPFWKCPRKAPKLCSKFWVAVFREKKHVHFFIFRCNSRKVETWFIFLLLISRTATKTRVNIVDLIATARNLSWSKKLLSEVCCFLSKKIILQFSSPKVLKPRPNREINYSIYSFNQPSPNFN